MVALDVGRSRAAARLDDVGVEGALHEKADRVALGRRLGDEVLLHLLERADELAPDDLALLLGVAHTGERVEERLARVDRDEAHPGGCHVVVLDLFPLALAQQPVIDEHRDQLVADCLVHEGRRDGRVDAAGQGRQHAPRSDLLADARDLLGDDVAAVPVGGEARRLVQEVLDDLLTLLGVLHLGVPLHAVEALLGVAECGDGRRIGRGEHLEALGCGGDLVAVAHPDDLVVGLAAEQHSAVARHPGIRRAVLAQAGVGDLSSELLGHHLEAVADTQGRHPELQHAGVERRRARLVHRRRPARQDQRDGVFGLDLGGRDGVRHDLAVDTRLADAARDQLRILRAEVDDEDGTLGGLGLSGHRVPSVAGVAGAAGACAAADSEASRSAR